jgi:hypothetical protein
LVPTDLRHFQPLNLRKPNYLPTENAQPRSAAIELLAFFEQGLIPNADTQERLSRTDKLAGAFEQVLGRQRIQAIVKGANPRQHYA